MISHLYEIRSPSGKSYIGISADPQLRWRQHLWAAERGSRLPIHAAIRKYGMTAMSAKVLATGREVYIREAEVAAIACLRTLVPRGYNVTHGGEVSPSKAPLVRAAIRASALRRWKDPAYAAEMGRLSRGRKRTPEQNAKAAAAKREHWQDPEYRAKLVAAHTGKKQSAETISRRSSSLRAAWARGDGAAARSAKMTGRRWVNDGAKNIQLRVGEGAPTGTFPGMVKK